MKRTLSFGGIVIVFLFVCFFSARGEYNDDDSCVQQQMSLQNDSLEPLKLLSLRNPFLTQEERNKFQREELKHLKLSAIFVSNKSSYAVVDGRIVRENDIIENKKVIRIERNQIILKDQQGREYVIRLKNIVN